MRPPEETDVQQTRLMPRRGSAFLGRPARRAGLALAAISAAALVTSTAAWSADWRSQATLPVFAKTVAYAAPSGLAGKHAAHKSHRKALTGKVIGIAPGHNGKNYTDPSFLDKQIWNGREWEDCDTTGTETNGGYPEPKFTWRVAVDLAAMLRKKGAKVVMTRHSNTGVGPCVNTRARILDRAHANVSIDIHADGGPSTGRGFTVLEPVADGPNNKVIKSSKRFGGDVHQQFLRNTSMGISNYYGHDGYIFRNDLAGLNLTTMPKVLIECGNMRNSADAKLLTSTKVQRAIAWALAVAIVRFEQGH
jgi:N-acetylmuramoyl-L-alanine amidase